MGHHGGSNLCIMDVEEENSKEKGNIYSALIKENFQNLEKEISTRGLKNTKYKGLKKKSL